MKCANLFIRPVPTIIPSIAKGAGQNRRGIQTLYTKKILCLANSIKNHEQGSGTCVAGREILDDRFGGWIRPVSARHSREISDAERMCKDGKTFNVLDVLRVPMLRHEPVDHQTENHVIDHRQSWARGKKARWRHVTAAVDTPPGPLWVNGHSTRNGLNDFVPGRNAAKLRRSLYLIVPDTFSIIVRTELVPDSLPKRRIRAAFSLNKTDYVWIITDPVVRDKYLLQKEGEYCIKGAALCISLGEPFRGNAYKLVAAVITSDMGA